MKNLFVVCVIIFALNTAFAYKYTPNSLENKVKNSTLIFKGKMQKILNGYKETMIVFVPEKIWKGNHQDTFFLSTAMDNISSNFKLSVGEDYIVFASSNKLILKNDLRIANKMNEIKLNFLFSELDKSDVISEAENEYFEAITNSKEDFKSKKILFTLNQKIITKNKWHKATFEFDEPSIQIVKLNEKEKQVYDTDYVFIAWSKQKMNAQLINNILKQLKTIR